MAQTRLQRLNQEYSRFSKTAGLWTEDERIQVAGFGHKEAARASAAARKMQAAELRDKQNLRFIEEDAKIKAASGLPPKVQGADTTIAHTVNVVLPKLNGVVPAGAAAVEVYTMAGDGTPLFGICVDCTRHIPSMVMPAAGRKNLAQCMPNIIIMLCIGMRTQVRFRCRKLS